MTWFLLCMGALVALGAAGQIEQAVREHRTKKET